MECPFCKEEVNENTKFCAGCGKDLSKNSPSKCSSCRVELIPGKNFCHKCGTQIRQEKTEVRSIPKSNAALIAIITCVVLLVGGTVLYITLMKARSRGQLPDCENNIKNIATAIDIYAIDNYGLYPLSLSDCPKYLKNVLCLPVTPLCPACNKPYLYEKGDNYYILKCGGEDTHIKTGEVDKGNFPVYIPRQGLILRKNYMSHITPSEGAMGNDNNVDVTGSQKAFVFGEQIYNRKNYSTAKELFSKAITMDPNNIEAYYYRALSANMDGSLQGDINYYIIKSKANREDYRIHFGLACCYLAQSETFEEKKKDAREELEKVMDFDKNGPFAKKARWLAKKYEINFDYSSLGLHVAVADGDKEAVKSLLDTGSNVNSKDEHGNSPLIIAVINGNKEMAELLINKGADVNVKSDLTGWTCLHYSIKFNNKKITRLLIDSHAEMSVRDKSGITPLYLASAYGYKELVEILIPSGADINATTNNGITPARIAEENGYSEIVKLILNKTSH